MHVIDLIPPDAAVRGARAQRARRVVFLGLVGVVGAVAFAAGSAGRDAEERRARIEELHVLLVERVDELDARRRALAMQRGALEEPDVAAATRRHWLGELDRLVRAADLLPADAWLEEWTIDVEAGEGQLRGVSRRRAGIQEFLRQWAIWESTEPSEFSLDADAGPAFLRFALRFRIGARVMRASGTDGP